MHLHTKFVIPISKNIGDMHLTHIPIVCGFSQLVFDKLSIKVFKIWNSVVKTKVLRVFHLADETIWAIGGCDVCPVL